MIHSTGINTERNINVNGNSKGSTIMNRICDANQLKILQICHGPVLPEYISAYSLRCHGLLPNLGSTIVSAGGTIVHDAKDGNTFQFHSLLLTLYAILKSNRSFEILLSRGIFLRRKYVRFVSSLIGVSDVIVFEGPWQYDLFRHLLSNKVIVYDAHNCEGQLRAGNKYHDYVEGLERELTRDAHIIFSVTNKDLVSLSEDNELIKKKIHLIPHVLPRKSVVWEGIDSNNICFIGSIYGPNISALNFILNLSSELPEYVFHIIGNVKSIVKGKKYRNVKFHGIVSEEEKTRILCNSLFALNPVSEGSGRNVKMMDYLLHQVPVISTEVGIRGFECYNIRDSVIVVELSDFSKVLKQHYFNRDPLAVYSRSSGILYKAIVENETKETPEKIVREYMFRNNWRITTIHCQ